MSRFAQVFNHITGQNEWEELPEDYDFHQEVANAGFGDMLHDTERNQKYYAALRKTIAQMHSTGREVHVLDIGSGTGILSMMAAVAGADSVTACECFLPMANCAERIIEANGLNGKIQLIKKRSTDLVVGVDMPRKANLLVAELLDTVLIGEGALHIYNHAHKNLLTNDVLCIPSKATCYAQVVQSPLAMQWNRLKTLTNLDAEILLKPPQTVLECDGSAALHDVQLSQLGLDQFRPLTDPIKIFEFNFEDKVLPLEEQIAVPQKTLCSGSTDLIFYWWDIKLDKGNEILLSCAPYWVHPDLKALAAKKPQSIPLPNVVPWRDHWMQAIYYINKPLQMNYGDEFILSCHHNDYDMWFNILRKGADTMEKKPQMCDCGLHFYARSRIGQINQSQRNKRYMHYLEEHINKDSHVLVLGDCSYIGLAAAPLGANSVLCSETQQFSRKFLQYVVNENNLKNVKLVEKLESIEPEDLNRITHVFAEPYFFSSILPWDNFVFGNIFMKLKEKLPANVQVSPHAARIFAVPVEFLDLHKIRLPVGVCEGFDLTIFDKMIEKSATITAAKVEAQPLWEYPGRALGSKKELLKVVFPEFHENQTLQGTFTIEKNGKCNGIALWVDWDIDGTNSLKSTVSTGPVESIVPGEFIKWDMFVRQGVHLLQKPILVQQNINIIQWSVTFRPHMGKILFDFTISN